MGRKPRPTGPFHVVTTRRRGKQREYVAHLLRRSYREGGKVKKETVANLSHLPDEVIELIRAALRGERFVAAGEAFEIERSLPAGHVEAALSLAKRLELSRLLDREPSRERALCLAMIVQRVIGPGSKLAMTRAFSQIEPGRGARTRGRGRGRALRRARLAARASGADRAGARAPPPAGRDARALRRLLVLLRRPLVLFGAARLLARPQARHAADRLRARLRAGRLPARGRGVRGLAARRQDAAQPDRQAQAALWALLGDRRLRPRHGHQGQPRAPA
jgi:hypothetical protein